MRTKTRLLVPTLVLAIPLAAAAAAPSAAARPSMHTARSGPKSPLRAVAARAASLSERRTGTDAVAPRARSLAGRSSSSSEVASRTARRPMPGSVVAAGALALKSASQTAAGSGRTAEAGPPPVRTGSVADRVASAWPGDDAKALRVVRCETGGSLDPRMRSRSGRYGGLWQFDTQTWSSAGGSGRPDEASVEEQTKRAWALQRRSGWAPWPVCGRR